MNKTPKSNKFNKFRETFQVNQNHRSKNRGSCHNHLVPNFFCGKLWKYWFLWKSQKKEQISRKGLDRNKPQNLRRKQTPRRRQKIFRNRSDSLQTDWRIFGRRSKPSTEANGSRDRIPEEKTITARQRLKTQEKKQIARQSLEYLKKKKLEKKNHTSRKKLGNFTRNSNPLRGREETFKRSS